MQDRMFCPFLFQFFEGKSFEKFTLSAEVGCHRGDKQTLAETTGTTEKIITPCCCQLINQSRLVHIHVTIVYQTLETLYSNRINHNRRIFAVKLQKKGISAIFKGEKHKRLPVFVVVETVFTPFRFVTCMLFRRLHTVSAHRSSQ